APLLMRCAMRCDSTVVLPVPAPATTSMGPWTCLMATRCCSVGVKACCPLRPTAIPCCAKKKRKHYYAAEPMIRQGQIQLTLRRNTGESLSPDPSSGRLGPHQENRQTQLVLVGWPVALGVVHGGDLHFARPQLGVGDGDHRVAAAIDRRHQAVFSFLQSLHSHSGVGVTPHPVDKTRTAGAKIVGQVADNGLFAGGGLDLVAQVLCHAHLLAVAEGIGLAV